MYESEVEDSPWQYLWRVLWSPVKQTPVFLLPDVSGPFSSVLSSSPLPQCLCGSQPTSASVRKGSFTRWKRVLQAGHQVLRSWQPESPTSCCTVVVQSLSCQYKNNEQARSSPGIEPQKLSVVAWALSSLSLVALKIMIKKIPRIQQIK